MSSHNAQLVEDVEKARKLVIRGLFAALVVFILFEALRGEQFWNKIRGEGNLWNYGSSLVYFMAGELAVLNAVLLGYHRKLTKQTGRAWDVSVWAAAGAAFVFFACDEMLEVHEKLGLAMERSMPLLQQLYPGHADNLITAAYGVGAVLFALVFFRGLLASNRARAYFILGFVMMAAAVSLDAIPREAYISRLPFRETEELLEVFAGWSFIAAFISSGALALTRILRASQGSLEDVVLQMGAVRNGTKV